jgi:HrpA-like RNA helicase
MNPRDLPIYRIEAEIRAAVAAHPVVVVESPAGSGKTTQIPQILYRAGLGEHGVLGVTQPRRIAAMSVSARIAQELRVPLGGLVGYKMRFADLTGPDTRIKLMTDGILLQELRHDPDLARYALIMVDEAHERSLNIDFILGLLKDILRRRRDLHVVVSSATLNAQAFCDYFDGAPLLSLDVRPWPIEVRHLVRALPPRSSLVDPVVDRVARVFGEDVPGDLLIFLPGEATILEAVERIRALPSRQPLEVLPLFGRLSKEEQDRVFDELPPGRRKVVVATNIAETSITIDGIRVVIDAGVAKIKSFNHDTGIGALVEQPVSRASCDQRTGRAGRTAPGVCYRLYTRKAYEERPEHSAEEIRRSDLSEVVLRMLSLGIRDVETFDFLAPPAPGAVRGAVDILQRLGAVSRDRRLTPIGEHMVDLPLEPRFGRMVIEAALNAPEVLDEVVTVAGFLSARAPFVLVEGAEEDARAAHRGFADSRGDFHTFLALFRAYRRAPDPAAFCADHFVDERVMREVTNVRQQILDLLAERGHRPRKGGQWQQVIRTVATGLPQLICRRDPRGGYRTVTSGNIYLHPGSALFRRPPDCFVAAEIVRTQRTFARSAAKMDPEWVAEIDLETYRALFGEERRRAPRERPPAPEPPTELRLGRRSWPIKAVRNQLLVTLPGAALATLPKAAELDELDLPTDDVRVQVELPEGVLLRGARVATLLRAAPHLRVEEGLVEHWPRDAFFTLPERTTPVLRLLPDVLRLAGTGARRRALGFLTLCTNGNGGYWYDVSYDLAEAVAVSLSALDTLGEELAEADLTAEAALARARRDAIAAVEADLAG